MRGAAEPPRGTAPSNSTSRPLRITTRTLSLRRRRSSAPTVSASSAPPGAPIVPKVAPAAPVIAGGRDDERVERRRPPHGPRLGPVGEARQRRRDSDQGDAGGVVGVSVAVRIDGALEAGDQLVGATVDLVGAARIALPAGDPDREDRGAGSDPAEGGRADDDARQLGAVALELRAIVGIGRGARVRIAADDVHSRQDVTAQVLVQTVDAGVEQSHRHTLAVVGRQAHLRVIALDQRRRIAERLRRRSWPGR